MKLYDMFTQKQITPPPNLSLSSSTAGNSSSVYFKSDSFLLIPYFRFV